MNDIQISCFFLPEFQADLFRYHASTLEVCVLWRSTKEVKMLCPMRLVVDATENSKGERKRGGRSVQLPDWAMNKIKRQHVIALAWVTKMMSFS